jgi:hypothetical protein
MKKSIFILLLLFLSSQINAQVIELPEVVITAVNYKYLNSVDSEENSLSVQMLQEKVAMFDLKSSEYYNDEYDTYHISFYIPEGKILAAYDKDGRLLRTVERFKNVKLPRDVQSAIAERFPNWTLLSDVYKVNFHRENAITKKQYKVKLKNGDKVMRVKLDDKGTFM